jgi:hypothetical protein
VMSGKVSDDEVGEEEARSEEPVAVQDDQLSAIMSAGRIYYLQGRLYFPPLDVVADLFQAPTDTRLID